MAYITKAHLEGRIEELLDENSHLAEQYADLLAEKESLISTISSLNGIVRTQKERINLLHRRLRPGFFMQIRLYLLDLLGKHI